ncbi:hypothetical protein HYT74_02185 [Candidatus Daviesbacteria bacterium]|nr:hypothetical protein [Candidatus Daviesbacteria bacterium]
MKKNTIIFILVVIAALIYILKDNFSINIGPIQNKDSSLETKESNDGPVSVTVTPKGWDFDITLNTHSEELSEDLVAVSELVDDQGKSYKPVSWEGSPPGGHHRNGVLKFNPISPKPKSLELKIKNVAGVVERSFKWDL